MNTELIKHIEDQIEFSYGIIQDSHGYWLYHKILDHLSDRKLGDEFGDAYLTEKDAKLAQIHNQMQKHQANLRDWSIFKDADGPNILQNSREQLSLLEQLYNLLST